MIRRIDFFMNTKSQHGVLYQCTQELQKALKRQGIASTSYDVFKQSLTEICALLEKNRPDCTMGFNVVLPEALFHDTIGIPHIAAIVDSATYYPELMHCPNTIVSFAEMDSIEFLESLGKKHLFFFPHACERSYATKRIGKKRAHSILMPASYIDPVGPSSILAEIFPKEVAAQIDAIIEESLACSSISHLVRLKSLFDTKPHYQEMVLSKGIALFEVFNMVELTMRGRDRLRLVQAIRDAEITIATSNEDRLLWQKALGRQKNVRYIDPIAYSELYDQFTQYRFIINSIPTIKRGFHERMFLAAAAGASVITNESLYQQADFPENHAVVTYLSPCYEQVAAKIMAIAEHEERRLRDVKKIKKMISLHHTWDLRAEQLLNQLPPLLKQITIPTMNFDW